jgi:hypothetical protein
MLTVPVVDCPKHVTAETISNIVKNIKLIVFERGMICMSFEEVGCGYPAVSKQADDRRHLEQEGGLKIKVLQQ